MSVLASSKALMTKTDSVGKRSRARRGVYFALGVYVVTRLFAVAAVVIAGRHQIPPPASLLEFHLTDSKSASPGYWTIVTNWDGQWYRDIAMHGYPVDLPRDEAGHVMQNVFGFYPLYPLLVGGLMWVTGLGFAVVGPVVSVVLGAVAVVVLFRLVQDALGTPAARMATVLTCTFMSAPVLQVGYTESLALLLLCSCLLFLRRRRYAWMALAIVLLALTRNVVLAMAPVILMHGWVRWRNRVEDPFTTRERLAIGSLAGLCVASAGLWPVIAGVATGEASAYTQTMSAWGGGLRVLVAWPRTFFNLLGPTGPMILFLMLFCLVGLLSRPSARAWGPELWGWAVSYPCYLLLATDAGSSTVRHLILAWPLGLLAVDFLLSLTSLLVRWWVLGLSVSSGLALQWIWISDFLVLTNPTHQPFP